MILDYYQYFILLYEFILHTARCVFARERETSLNATVYIY